jgi:hypothetical protein
MKERDDIYNNDSNNLTGYFLWKRRIKITFFHTLNSKPENANEKYKLKTKAYIKKNRGVP